MIKLLQSAIASLKQGKPITLVTVISSQGSTPRREGAVMVVDAHGLVAGTIGGGLLEYRCTQLAQVHLGEQSGFIEEFVLDNQQAGGLGMICGGTTQVLFTPLHEILPLAVSTSNSSLYLPLDGGQPRHGAAVIRPQILGGDMILPLQQPGRIFLMGGGHVALETAHLLERLDFPYVVVDDREEFSNQHRFAGAEATLLSSYNNLSQALEPYTPTAEDAICIMTRGHMGDIQCVRFALQTDMTYIGVMGSRTKGAKMLAQLEEEGFLQFRQRITTPIGLPIGGQTPAELAVSIVAQLIQWRAQRQ